MIKHGAKLIFLKICLCSKMLKRKKIKGNVNKSIHQSDFFFKLEQYQYFVNK
jgi:hypothetical protein